MKTRTSVIALSVVLAVLAGCQDDPPDSEAPSDAADGATISKKDANPDTPDTDSLKDVTRDIADTQMDTSPTDTNGDTEPTDSGPTDTSSDATETGVDTVADVTPDAPSSDGSGSDGGNKNWRACGKSSDCILTKNDCCGWCSTPALSDLDPVNRNRTTAHHNDVCNKTNPICPACAQGPIPDSFKAHCSGGTCAKIDLQQYQSCSKDADCRVRTLDCCEDCQADTSKEALVAINKSFNSQVKSALCPNPAPGCANCAIQYPSGVTAECNSNKRCVLK